MAGLFRRDRDRAWRLDPLAHAGRILVGLAPAAFAVSALHRARAYETPLVATGVALLLAGIACLLIARRRHRETPPRARAEEAARVGAPPGGPRV